MPILVLATLLLTTVACCSPAFAEGCPGNPAALGTSRVIAIDALEHRKLGYIEYEETLPLHDREVVLTFDDGPIPPYTSMVLDTLAAECVKATFFIVGQEARANPLLVQRAFREGHTIGTHTEHHAHLNRIPPDQARKEIEDGIVSVKKALGGKGTAAPFFRFPYFDGNARMESLVLGMGLTIWNTDLHASDWNMVPAETVKTVSLTRLERRKKGIILLHDIHDRTAQALPGLLRELKVRGFRIVHVVPAGPNHPKTEAKPDEWLVTD